MCQYSIVNLSKLEKSLRIDPSYYMPSFLAIDDFLTSIEAKEIGSKEISKLVTDGDHGFPIYAQEGLHYLRSQDFNPLEMNLETTEKVTQSYAEKVGNRCQARANDVILSTVGTIGTASLIKERSPLILSRDVARIVVNEANILPEYLFLFLNSKLGKLQVARLTSGSIQGGLYLHAIKRIKIPTISKKDQEVLVPLVEKMLNLVNEAKHLRIQAETLLEKDIHKNGHPTETKKTTSYLVKLSFARKEERLDAEYYQPKYDDILKTIREYSGGYAELGTIIQSLTNGVEFREYYDDGVPYVRVNDILNGMIDYSQIVRIPQKEAEVLRRKIGLSEHDVLLSRSGTLGLSAYLRKTDLEAVLSSHIFRIRLNDPRFLPEYVSLFLHSRLGREQIYKYNNGGIVPEISQNWVKKIILPLIDKNVQQTLKEQLNKSSSKRDEASQTLNQSIMLMETMIQQLTGKPNR